MPQQRRLFTFRELVDAEHRQLEAANIAATKPNGSTAKPQPEPFDGDVTPAGESGEPWLARTSTDRVGLALSGGGIRSATFGLGLMQALGAKGLLGIVDYVSTVSGGGYLGGFWTAWKQRDDTKEEFPLQPDPSSGGAAADKRERAEIRHLREFSRFLSPRIGVNEPEMWYAVAAVLGGMLPALLATLSLVALVFYAWLGIGYVAVGPEWGWVLGDFWIGGAMIVLVVIALWRYWRSDRQSRKGWQWAGTYIGVIATAEVGLAAVYVWVTPVFLPAWMLVFAGASVGNHLWREILAARDLRSEPGKQEGFWSLVYWIVALATVAIGMWLVDHCVAWWNPGREWGWVAQTSGARTPSGFVTFSLEPAIVWVALALLIAAAWIVVEGLARFGELFLRMGEINIDDLRETRLRRSELRDKLTSRYLAWGLCLAAIVGIWELAFWLDGFLAGKGRAPAAPSATGLATTGGLTAVFAGLFAWLRDWLSEPDKEQTGGGIWQKVQRNFKSWIPAAVATAGALSLIIFTILLMRYFGLSKTADDLKIWQVVAGAAVVVFVALKFFDPGYFGLHDFYRSRISRAYLGAAFVKGSEWDRYKATEGQIEGELTNAIDAARKAVAGGGEVPLDAMQDLKARLAGRRRVKPGSRDNRFTGERSVDDLCLTTLKKPNVRPIHLICCAANHLSGDDLPNLYRGARSAVLSQRGISLGEDTVTPSTDDPPLMLSAAQTASAAAFNSQMGEKSIRLGRGSSFLMTALNLRLGLWVLNPVKVRADADEELLRQVRSGKFPPAAANEPGRRRRAWDILAGAIAHFPGQAFIGELLRSSKCLPEDRHAQLHLSDGGHFENLGLYELIRRHCAYVILSDAGQDETVAFDDLGNAIRRVREDFGVEIEIDWDPIRPNEKLLSRQHVVVGTIHYDGFEGRDKGTLIYIKPTLTGDEPGDIQQYRTRNENFPHESTGDQFFSEAQWESYRRLGEHIGHVAFAFLDQMNPDQRKQAETVFWRARSVWTVLPPGYEEKFQDLNNQTRDLDDDICKNAPPELRAEFFPELGLKQAPASSEDEVKTVYYVFRILLLIENAWLTLDLRRFWAHPMNDGWMNYLNRWAWTPSFRRWWVILCPLFSIDFRDFIKSRFELRLRDPAARASDSGQPGPMLFLRLGAPNSVVEAGHTARMLALKGRKPDLTNRYCFEYLLHIEQDRNAPPKVLELQVGLLMVEIVSEGARRIAKWSTEDFYVPEPLSGSGIVGRFLERVKAELLENPFEVHEIRVGLVGHEGRDPASRALRLQTIDFYKSRNFQVVLNANGSHSEMRLVLR